MIRGFLALTASLTLAAVAGGNAPAILHAERTSPGDLEVGGEIAGIPAGATRYIRYGDLLEMPLKKFTVKDDSNFQGSAEIEGVPLEALAQRLGSAPDDALIVAICYDNYRANFSLDYRAAHNPLLVLRINGRTRDHWPSAQSGGSLGPYLISHAFFKPAFRILSHEDEAQIPFGVTRVEVRRESVVYGAIRPPGKWRADSPVDQGYRIAREDCFRCHNQGAEGGTLAGRSWLKLAARAEEDSGKFKQTIRNPTAVNANAKMPAHADYDEATLNALSAYFKTFAQTGSKQ